MQKEIAEAKRQHKVKSLKLRMIQKTSREKTKELLLMSRKQIKVIVGLLTGHCALKGHLHRIGLYNGDLKCRLCNRETETAQHVLCYCETLDRKRQDIWTTQT
ncbi:hypothetical protein NQ317_018772 [Molorchus minor]|uniref:Reverse transcriptase zinc-binding domain-containing protein n=1 Tax=Molorchus minor TaxID=1323400 RepID=A0ABQ9J6K2_9CUCU|nr:hypothetical protein NQ317_018772 [Molorchus minor]